MSAGVVALDIMGYYHRGSDAWPKGAFVLLGLAVASGLLAGTVGFIDWLGIPKGTRAKRIGLLHAASNLASLTLLAVSLGLRWESPAVWNLLATGMSTFGVMLFGLGGWLPAESSSNGSGLSVDPDANLDASELCSARTPNLCESRPGRAGGDQRPLAWEAHRLNLRWPR